MIVFLEENRQAIAELCTRYGVVRLDVFGSVLRDDFRPDESDVDLLAEFAPRDPYELAKDYFDMLDELEELLGVKVDLVMVGAVKNPYIADDIEQTKQLLYAA
ncbi:MAG: nucleotidyltransferase family protein [Thermoleophilia bacterium]|nr:nucleotidyltransferase family protein [Thermoleophilia bacterium]